MAKLLNLKIIILKITEGLLLYTRHIQKVRDICLYFNIDTSEYN